MNTAEDATTTPISTIQRRNSIVTPSPLTLDPCSTTSSTPTTTTTTSSSSSTDFELVSFKPASYTSLRDILPSTASTIMSPTPPSFAVHSGYEISIRNRLVKQAAWAYLQPMSTSPDSGLFKSMLARQGYDNEKVIIMGKRVMLLNRATWLVCARFLRYEYKNMIRALSKPTMLL